MAICPFKLLPVHKSDRWRQHLGEAGAFDGLKALACAADLFPATVELHRSPAARFDLEEVMLVADEGAAQHNILVVKLDAHDTLANAGQDGNVADREVDDSAFLRG